MQTIERLLCDLLWLIFKYEGYDSKDSDMQAAYEAFLEGDKKKFRKVVTGYLNKEC